MTPQRIIPLPHRSAFTLLEMLMVIGIMTMVMGISGELFRSVVAVGAENHRLSNLSAQTDSAIFKLRRDVWACGQMTLADPHSVQLSISSAGPVFWAIDADGSVKRIDATGHVEQWPAIGKDWTFSADGPTLSISAPDSQGLLAVRLISQVLLSRRTAS